jgi:phosphohistidine phosphatase
LKFGGSVKIVVENGENFMQLLLMRHGIASPQTAQMRSDDERPLANEGESETGDVALELKETIAKIDLVASSPLLRAKQTAQIISAPYNARHEIWPEMEAGDFEEVVNRLRALEESGAGDATILLVGHQPGIGILAQQLTKNAPPAASYDFAPAAICAIDVETFEPLDARLLWQRSPQSW